MSPDERTQKLSPPVKALTTRQVLRSLVGGDMDKPVLIRLGLWDNRVAYGLAHSTTLDGHYVLVLQETPHIAQRSMAEHDVVRRKLGRNESELWED